MWENPSKRLVMGYDAKNFRFQGPLLGESDAHHNGQNGRETGMGSADSAP
jgi:hypothetical protein